MARGDLFDFGNPTDPDKRNLEGQYIGGAKAGGTWDVPKRDGGLFDMPKKPERQGVEKLGKGLDEPGSDLGSPWVLIALLIVVAAVLWFVFIG